jgi:uncharacterized protein
MTPIIVPGYGALLCLIYIYLAIRVIRLRRSGRIGIGTGGNPLLERAMRVHANFAEYVPLALLLLAFVEIQARPKWLVHALCVVLLVGRAVHAYGVSQEREDIRLRSIGVVATFAVLVIAALALLVNAVRAILV